MRRSEQARIDRLQAGAMLLAERGYESVRAEDLARSSQVSVGTLYRDHGTKAAFAAEVRALTEQELLQFATQAWRFSWDPASSTAADFGQAFLTVWHAMGQWAAAQQSLFTFTFVHHHPDADAEDGARAPQVRALLCEMLEVGVAVRVVRPKPTWVLSGVLWGTLVELVRTAHSLGVPLDETAVRDAGEAVWSAVRHAQAVAPGPLPSLEPRAATHEVSDEPRASMDGSPGLPCASTPDVPGAAMCGAPVEPRSSMHEAPVELTASTDEDSVEPMHQGTQGDVVEVSRALQAAPRWTGTSTVGALALACELARAAEASVAPARDTQDVARGRAPARDTHDVARGRAPSSPPPCCPCAPRLRPQTLAASDAAARAAAPGSPSRRSGPASLRPRAEGSLVPASAAGLALPDGDLAPTEGAPGPAPAPGPAVPDVDPARTAALAFHAAWRWGRSVEPSIILEHMAALGFDPTSEADVARAWEAAERGALDFDFVLKWTASIEYQRQTVRGLRGFQPRAAPSGTAT